MKRSITIFGLLFISLAMFTGKANAQVTIPNASFENWKSNTLDDDWGAFSIGSIPVGDMKKDTTAQDGNFAVRITSSKPSAFLLPALIAGGISPDVIIPGTLTNGSINLIKVLEFANIFIQGGIGDLSDFQNLLKLGDVFDGGFPIDRNPTKFNGYYKCDLKAATEASAIVVILYNTDTTTVQSSTGTDSTVYTRRPIGAGVKLCPISASDYEYFSEKIQYIDNNAIADQMVFMALSAVSLGVATGEILQEGSSLTLDNISLSGAIGITPISLGKDFSFQIYPNPSNGNFRLDISSKERASVNVYNLLGQVVWSTPNYDGKIINLKNAGTYIVQITVNSVTKSHKIIITK